MADVNSNLDNWSATVASNSPSGSTNIGTGLDDNLRQIQATVREYLATKGADIASAATTDLSTATGNRVDITGVVTITAFGTLTAGMWKILKFTGALTLTHNGTSLILPGSANITTAAGDFCMATSLGSGNWEVNWYQPKSGLPVVGAPFIDSTAIIKGSADATKLLRVEVDGLTTATTRVWTAYDRDGFIQISEDAWLYNATLAASVAANALTVALKTKAAADPSTADPVYVGFRNATAGTGDYTVIKITAATSIVVSSGSTLGTVSAQASRIYVTAHNDAGTLRLGVYNPWDDTNKALLGLDESILYSSTAEGGAGAADSAQVIYTGTAVTTKAMVILGYVESTQATAGTWATTPSKVQLMRPGAYRTGDVVQRKRTTSGALASGTTAIPFDDTIPQITEGDEYITQAITPTSAINLLDIRASLVLSGAGANVGIIIEALFQDATVNALTAMFAHEVDASPQLAGAMRLEHLMVALTASSTTLRIRAGANNTNGINFNGAAAARLLGGVMNSYIRVEEIFV